MCEDGKHTSVRISSPQPLKRAHNHDRELAMVNVDHGKRSSWFCSRRFSFSLDEDDDDRKEITISFF